MSSEGQELARRLRIIFAEIIRGFSFNNSEEVYLKHPTEMDVAAIEYVVDIATHKAIARGLLSEDEIIKNAIKI